MVNSADVVVSFNFLSFFSFFFFSLFFNSLLGPGTKCGNIGQQLVESKKEILKEKKATKRNETVGNCDKGLSKCY